MMIDDNTHTHTTHTALWILSGTTWVWVSQYQKKYSPTHTYRGHRSSLISFFHLIQSMASSLFNLHALQSFSTNSLQVFFGLPLGLAPSTSYSIHFFTQVCKQNVIFTEFESQSVMNPNLLYVDDIGLYC